eukprot:SAG11_NODE_3599_length_2346_cov_3.414775_3_plen_172_part_00
MCTLPQGQLPHRSLSKDSVLYQCAGSLERLQVEAIDIYYLHGPDIDTDIDETLEAIGELHKAGKIGAHELRHGLCAIYQNPSSAATAGRTSQAPIRSSRNHMCAVEFGLSNYPAWKVVDIFYRCRARGIVPPTVYQGCYNALTRSMEFEAAACVRGCLMRPFMALPNVAAS